VHTWQWLGPCARVPWRLAGWRFEAPPAETFGQLFSAAVGGGQLALNVGTADFHTGKICGGPSMHTRARLQASKGRVERLAAFALRYTKQTTATNHEILIAYKQNANKITCRIAILLVHTKVRLSASRRCVERLAPLALRNTEQTTAAIMKE
jgi:hypothetical protein